ncbi:hypothetical protein [Actinoplanes sp. NPDC049118]|uniref:hypothetical protein n=1 Tax=Actinoplanes sp. NPDC049118 TaxID=3155769 RepID=UPI003400A8DC
MRRHRFGRPGTRLVLAAVLAVSALGIGACGQPATPVKAAAAPPAAVPDAAVAVNQAASAARTPAPQAWRRCVNSPENYSVEYPRGWHTTQIRPREVCAQFHPTRFTIAPDSEYPLTALNVRRVTALPSRTSTEFERTLRWQRTTISGRSAVRFETSSTGAGMDRAGTRRYGYVLRLGHSLISVHTAAEPGETRYAAWKTVVDKAARTVTAAPPSPATRGCVAIRPPAGHYEGGRVATGELRTPNSRCSTVSASHVADPANPEDRCQTFLVGFWPLVDGSLTYTEPVTACGTSRTVLARNVPDNARYLVLYDVDYIEPEIQKVRFKVWH